MEREAACTLIAASCTTGWFDWIHGELWLCPDGMLRRSLGLRTTISHVDMGGANQTVDPENRPTRAFSSEEVRQIAGAGKRNHWIAWEDVSHATLKGGLVDHSLHLELRDGSRVKFLWLRMDGGGDLLKEALSKSLGGRFRAG